jgi:hypothetical protein
MTLGSQGTCLLLPDHQTLCCLWEARILPLNHQCPTTLLSLNFSSKLIHGHPKKQYGQVLLEKADLATLICILSQHLSITTNVFGGFVFWVFFFF